MARSSVFYGVGGARRLSCGRTEQEEGRPERLQTERRQTFLSCFSRKMARGFCWKQSEGCLKDSSVQTPRTLVARGQECATVHAQWWPHIPHRAAEAFL